MSFTRRLSMARTLVHAGLGLVGVSLVAGSAHSEVRYTPPELERVALGPVTAIDSGSGSVTVLGQSFSIGRNTLGAGWSSGRINIGDYVFAVGIQSDSGVGTALLARLNDDYVPGASTVFLQAPVEFLDVTTGFAESGDLLVDYTPALVTQPASPAVGQMTAFVGVQPVLGGTLLASSFLTSISGGDRHSWSISGGDSARLSISGGDSAGLSISGGDSAQWSISGGDASRLSISGGDSAQLSISGGDRSRLSISGGDSSQLSISGGDSAQWSISGGDASR
ncbi:MAG: hypothetical protein JJU27_19370, partial [Gammaproteobacteria bacterium]|nr:hypothetical protein [Gammaproteobacteria bacterium]